MSKFIAVSRQATELDKTRLLLETRIKEVKEESKGKEVVDEGVKTQPRPPTGEKRKNISSRVD